MHQHQSIVILLKYFTKDRKKIFIINVMYKNILEPRLTGSPRLNDTICDLS